MFGFVFSCFFPVLFHNLLIKPRQPNMSFLVPPTDLWGHAKDADVILEQMS